MSGIICLLTVILAYGGNVFSVDRLAELGVIPRRRMFYIPFMVLAGAKWFLYAGWRLFRWGGLTNFDVEVGGMDYGFAINGILGMDFLIPAGAQIDLKRLELEF